MLNKESLEKSADLRRGENREFWEGFDKTLQKQRVEVTFKMDGHFYTETINSVGSPYLCEFSNKEINFFEFKPQSLNWKNSLRFKLIHVVDEIELIGFAILRRVIQRYRLRLDGNAAFFLNIHGIQHLRFHLAFGQAAAILDETVGKRGFAVVNMGDDGEIADMGELAHAGITRW